MDFSLFLTIVVVAICFVFLRKLRFDPENQVINQENQEIIEQENKDIDQENSVSPPSSLAVSTVNPPTSSSDNWLHDVFPSFRGEDVRIDFLSHIQKEFGRKGITPFVDNEIKRGESIAPELIQAIRGSNIAIIFLSKNYASSKWCLNELVEIMNCRENLGQTVMVIFYKVDPSHVKKLAGDFGKVFEKTCEGQSKEDIERWTQALMEVATIAGYDSSNWDNEAAMIEKIAMDISNKLINYAPSSDFDGLVGMRAHMENMNLFLHLDSNEVKMIGIWGPSGIGKSTIARVLYSQYSRQFQLSVFMENIKTRYPKIPGYDEYSAKLQLQKEFLSQILNQEEIKIHHLGVVQDRLKHKRVLVVLDDVDHSMQLDAMAKETSWFGPGSRVIVTTQDKKIFNAHGIKHIYKVDFPLDHEALQIFCTYAFGQKYPDVGFWNLASEVTQLAGKLPLGLRVLGSYFKGMLKHEWKKALPRLRTSLDGEIKSTLKFSYNGLHAEDKDLFLYIACFFNNCEVEKVEAYLAKNFSDVSHGLQILAEKSIISISSGYIMMHDLLARLGREVVCEQSIQFLVDARDVCRVLNNDSHGSVIGIIINFSEVENDVNRIERAIERMSSLQFLRIKDSLFSNSYLPRSLNNLSREVKLLEWNYFPMKCLPSNFNPEFLVELKMPFSKLETLWEGIKSIRNLKWMDLSYSDSLRELPDLSTAISLCQLVLSSCTSLVELPFSIGCATNLRILLLDGCSNLRELPSPISNATNLEVLIINGCANLVKLPSFVENAINLQQLRLGGFSGEVDFTGCSSLVDLPSYIWNARLTSLKLSGCLSLIELPSSIGNAINLQKIDLSGCTNLVELPSSVENAINLERLNLSGCSRLVRLPSFIGNLHNLLNMGLQGCSKQVIPTNISRVPLYELDLTNCSSLKTIPEISTHTRVLKLSGTAIEKVPSSLRSWSRLDEWYVSHIRELHMSDTAIQEVPPWVKGLYCLDRLVIKGCTNLVSLPQLPDSLRFLDAENCESLERLHCSFHNIKFAGLKFANCFKLNQEARDLIIKASTSTSSLFPGETVPTRFTYQANGSTLSMKSNGFGMPHTRSDACVLLVNKGDVEDGDGKMLGVSYCIKGKQNGVNGSWVSEYISLRSPLLKKHLFIFELNNYVSSNELVFEFVVQGNKMEIGECGICTPTDWVTCNLQRIVEYHH